MHKYWTMIVSEANNYGTEFFHVFNVMLYQYKLCYLLLWKAFISYASILQTQQQHEN